jgi:hypothetical protein
VTTSARSRFSQIEVVLFQALALLTIAETLSFVSHWEKRTCYASATLLVEVAVDIFGKASLKAKATRGLIIVGVVALVYFSWK